MRPDDKKHPPRGYVDREDWEAAYKASDPGDFWRKVRVNFIPHREHQLPHLIPVMSVEEHTAVVDDLKRRLDEAKAVAEEAVRLCEMGCVEGEQREDSLGDLARAFLANLHNKTGCVK